MTKEQFGVFLRDPATGPKLDAMLAECRVTDAELESIRQKARNDDLVTTAIRAFFRRTDPVNR